MPSDELERSNREANEAAAQMQEDKQVVWAGNRWITNPDHAPQTVRDTNDSEHSRSADNPQSVNERLYEREPEPLYICPDCKHIVGTLPSSQAKDCKGVHQAYVRKSDYDRTVEELKHARLEREDAIHNASLADEQVHEWYARAEAAERKLERWQADMDKRQESAIDELNAAEREIERLSRAMSAEQMLRPGTISRAQANRERDSLEKDYEPLVVRAEAAERKVERLGLRAKAGEQSADRLQRRVYQLEDEVERLKERLSIVEVDRHRKCEALREIRLIADSLPEAGRIHAITRAALAEPEEGES